MKKVIILKILCLLLGFICVILGAIGAFLPVIPTCPFLLLAMFLFTKASTRVSCWFTSTRLYQRHLESFYRDRCMTKRSKICILTFSTIGITTSMYLVPIFPIRLLLLAVILLQYYYFIFRIGNKKRIPSLKESHIADCNS